MNTAERFEILKTELCNIYNNLHKEIDETENIKQLKLLQIKINNCIEMQYQQYEQDVRKIFGRQRIENLNPKDFLTDEDLKSLVIGGYDEFTSLGSNQLEDIVKHNLGELSHSNIMEMIKEAFGSNHVMKARVLRWVLRGLSIDHAITKIQWDLKTYKN